MLGKTKQIGYKKRSVLSSVLDNVVCRSVESVIIEIEVHLADESG